ncbi:hypothetical protein KPH14_007249 [Odynerus spinipes]|uniref:Ankyrin-2 n=1 Tax=Odynerus spinipes TaxID=1348599 RepID=A0AAD9R9W6_9HYME|nr:hypothetical protein KPH14_007249 [Odynerus spinipes]
MTATYADESTTSGIGSEERKAVAAWTTCAAPEEACGMSLLAANASGNHDGSAAGAPNARRGAEESPRTTKNEIIDEDTRSNSMLSVESCPRVRCEGLSVRNFEDGEEKREEKVGASRNSGLEEDVEQVSTTKIEGRDSRGKFPSETDALARNEEDFTKARTDSREEEIESVEGSSLEDLRRSIETELVVAEDSKDFSPKKVIITCGTFEATTDGTACGVVVVGDDEKRVAERGVGQETQVDQSKDESYDPEIGLDFHEAVRAGDAKRVAALLANARLQNLDEPDWNVSGDPPLLVAATNHSLPILSILLANGCDPGVRSPRGETALHRVILNGGPGNVLNFVGELLKYGCPAGVKEAGGGLTALHVLTRQLAHAQNNNHKTEIESLIETLLAAGANPALKNDRGESPLHECLECGALNTASLLIPHTPPGVMSRYGETPLHIASRKNYVDMVAKLLEHGEDPSVQDAGGNTPLHLASARGFHRTVSLLVTSPLAQLEKTNLDGLTALQVAAESGFVNAVKLLLKAGADPSQTIHYCTTTLHRHPDISILIDHELTRRRQLAT